ncbi:hypothetical protein N9093_01400 [bacterium]|nr:hypothetical protein [bacterium]
MSRKGSFLLEIEAKTAKDSAEKQLPPPKELEHLLRLTDTWGSAQR